MAIYDGMLTEVAKAISGESYELISHMVCSSDSSFAVSVSDSSLSGEFGSRVATTDSRSGTTVTFNSIRTGASLVSSSGDTLYGAGLFTSSSGGTLMAAITLPSLLHTDSFDIEFDWDIIVQRTGG